MSWNSQGEDKYAAWGVSSFEDPTTYQAPAAEAKEDGLDRLRKEWLSDESVAASLPKSLHVRYSAERAWDGSPVFVVTNPETRETVAFMKATETDLRFGSGEVDLPAVVSRRMVEPTADNIRLGAGYRWEAPAGRGMSENGGPPRLDTRAMVCGLLASLRGE